MIGFQINGEFLDLPNNPSVELNRNSPVFQQEGFVVEDYTLPVTFPNTPKNARILNWPHVVENAHRTRAKWDCILFYNGVPRLKGELRAKNPVNQRSISANFVRGISQIGEDIKERSIREIVNETITIHNQPFQKSITLDYYTGGVDNRYALIINGKSYEGTTMVEFLAAIDADEEKTFTVTNPSTNRIVITNNSTDELDPFEIEEFSYAVEGDRRGEGTAQRRAAWQWVEVPQWSIDYNNTINAWAMQYIGNDPDKPFRLGTIYNKARETAIPQVNAPVINFIDQNGLRPNVIQSGNFDLFGEVYSGSSIAPFLTIDHVLRKIEEYYSITIDAFFREYEHDDPFVLLHPNTIDQPLSFLVPFGFVSRATRSKYANKENYKASNLYNFYRREFNLSEFVPDMKVNDLLKALQVYFNTDLNYDNDSRTLSYTNRKQYVQEREYTDITERCEIFTDVQNPVLEGVRLTVPRSGDDKLDLAALNVLADPYHDYSTGGGERAIEMPLHILPTVDFSSFDSVFNSASVPKVVCAMEVAPSDKFPLTIGIAQSYASGSSVDGFDLCRITSLTTFQNLTWAGTHNAFEKYWKDWILLEDSLTECSTTWHMTREQVFNLDFTKKLRIDRSDFLLKSFNVGMRNNGLTMADCVFVKVPFFRERELPTYTYAWRGVESSLYCLRTFTGFKPGGNSGQALYGYLEQYIVETGEPTGLVKSNRPIDPDYIFPFENYEMCPVEGLDSYQTKYLYITLTEGVSSPQSKIIINGVTYQLPDQYPNPVPYPFLMPAGRTTVTIELSNSGNDIEDWKMTVYKGSTQTNVKSVTIHPGNLVRRPRKELNDPESRRFTFDTLYGDMDPNFYNRIVITRKII